MSKEQYKKVIDFKSKKSLREQGIVVTDRSIRLAQPDEVVAQSAVVFSGFIKKAVEAQKKADEKSHTEESDESRPASE